MLSNVLLQYPVLSAPVILNSPKPAYSQALATAETLVWVDMCLNIIDGNCISRAVVETISTTGAIVADAGPHGRVLSHLTLPARTAHSQRLQSSRRTGSGMACKVSNRKNRLASYDIVRNENMLVQLTVDFHSGLSGPKQPVRSNKRYSKPRDIKTVLTGQNGMVDCISPPTGIQSARISNERSGFQRKQLLHQSFNV